MREKRGIIHCRLCETYLFLGSDRRRVLPENGCCTPT